MNRLLPALLIGLAVSDHLAAAPEEDASALLALMRAAHATDCTERCGLVQEWMDRDWLVDESRRPDPPWDEGERWIGLVIDGSATTGPILHRRVERSGGYVWHSEQVFDQGRLHYADLRAGDALRRSPTSRADALRPLARYVPGVLIESIPEDALRVEQGSCDQNSEALEWGEEGAWQRLDVDPRGRICRWQHRFRDYDGRLRTVSVQYWAYDTRVPHHPGRARLAIDGVVHSESHRLHQQQNVDPSAWLKGHRSRNYREPQPVASGLRIEQPAPGLWWVGEGVMFQLFVETSEGLLALDTGSGDLSARLATLRQQTESPIRYAMVSHAHADHLHGVAGLAAEGATVLAAPDHLPQVRSAAAHDIKLSAIEGAFELESGAVVIEQIGPTPHSEQMLVAWLAQPKILFAADLFVVARQDGTVAATPNARALLQAIDSRGWPVQTLMDPHTPFPVPIARLREAVQRAELAASRECHVAHWKTLGTHCSRLLGEDSPSAESHTAERSAN